MAINKAGADAYFKKTVKASLWASYSAAQRESAIEDAKMTMSRALHRKLNEDEAAYQPGDQTRDEYCIYEQAIYMLANGVQPTGGGTAVPALDGAESATNNTGKGASRPYGIFAPDALRWLGEIQNRAVLS